MYIKRERKQYRIKYMDYDKLFPIEQYFRSNDPPPLKETQTSSS